MDLSSAIQGFNRRNLQPVSTVVTQTNGEKHLETKGMVDKCIELPDDPSKVLGVFYVIDNSPDENIYKVISHLYIGSQDGASNKQALTESNITHILNVAIGIEDRYPLEFIYLDKPVYDIPEFDIMACLEECCKFIMNAIGNGGSVLVHCNAGVSRSSTVIIAYLMKYHNNSYTKAYDLVKLARETIKPNDGFIKQLKEFERSLQIQIDIN